MTGMDLQGEKALRKVLNQLGPRIARKVTRGALSKAADPIVRAARQNAKRLGSRRVAKGRTRKGVYLIEMRSGHQLARAIGKRVKTYTAQGVIYVAVGPRFPQGAHGHLVEYGHKPSGWYAKQTGATYIPPQPFLRPAFDAHKRQALTLATQHHRANVEREAQKATYHARAGKIGATWTQILGRGG